MGIAFAVLLMLVELGFRDAFLESALQIIRGFDADIVLVSATKFRFGRKDPFSRRHLYVARGSPGVASAAPVIWPVPLILAPSKSASIPSTHRSNCML